VASGAFIAAIASNSDTPIENRFTNGGAWDHRKEASMVERAYVQRSGAKDNGSAQSAKRSSALEFGA